MKRGAHRDHEFQASRDSSQGRCRRPGIERRRLRSLDVVEVQLGNQGEVKTNFFAAARKAAHILPACLHVFIFNIAQPAAEYRKPISVTHYAASCSRKSTRRTKGLKPITF